MTPQETLTFTREQLISDLAAGEKACPVCSRAINVDHIDVIDLPEDVQKLIFANSPGVPEVDEVCGRCARLFERAKTQIIEDAAMKKDGSHVLSTPLRLDADERFTGKGVTIAFLDSGFYPHADLTTPTNRIVAYRNMLHDEGDVASLF